MALVKVTYNVVATQYIDWPDEETYLFNYENLECNLDPHHIGNRLEIGDILDVQVDGKPFEF